MSRSDLAITIVTNGCCQIPISEGGAAFAWSSPLVVVMLAVGGAMILIFLVVEWRFARLPIMPRESILSSLSGETESMPRWYEWQLLVPYFWTDLLLTIDIKVRLFNNDKSANLILMYSTLHGFAYWANLFNVPLYLQNVRGYGPIISGAVIVPMLVSHGVGSIISGQIISRTGRYNNVILPGNMVWALGVSLQTLYTRTTPIYAVCLVGFLQGIGIGCAFQC